MLVRAVSATSDDPPAASAAAQEPGASPSPDSFASGAAPSATRPYWRFPVVGIGASAGGLEAIEGLTHRLVSAEEMAFVIVQHLAPSQVSMLADIIRRGARLPVVTAEDGMRIESGTIYVAPPDAEVSLHQGRFVLTARTGLRAPLRTIDAFFESLSRACGPLAIGVVLSGAGRDGTAGLHAIQEAGGTTFAQDPNTASQASMPRSALESGCVDFSLTASEIGEELVRLSGRGYVSRARPTKVLAAAMVKIFALLKSAFGVDFALYKPSTVDRRIHHQMALRKVEDLKDYLTLLTTDLDALRALYDDLFIGVTRFFRDIEPYDALTRLVFPRILENRSPEVPVRLWVAGCATGEEAYSIAFVLLESLGDRAFHHPLQIFATDVDEDALVRARQATYPHAIEKDVSPERLARFFSRSDEGFVVAREVRDLILFARHDLAKDPPFSRLDLVACRNVFIYLKAELQRRVLRIFHYALNPGGFLLLGTSESIGEQANLFSLLDPSAKLYARKHAPAVAPSKFRSRVVCLKRCAQSWALRT